MDKTGITKVGILLIAAIFFCGCTSPSSTVPSPAPVSADEEYTHLLLSPEDLPAGIARVVDGPLRESDITRSMKNYGLVMGHRALYADAIPPTDNTRMIQQDILVFNGANASAMLDEYQKTLTERRGQNVVALSLPDPNLGEKSFAIRVSTVSLTTGIETHHYVFGFVRSGIFEVISMDGTPETYPTLLPVVERAAGKAR